ncbi:hypothetical protein BT96DRAFT_1005183 [Gymnopus androsaceus JB14]|uniref:Uncharacterized protein n=1 Tax=Gymnopus androsaceus JB14 TaxID=1447944 RepID=A0A6A4GNM2_9AGAR|nr:hypothetical protein BT96DRAFT_1005183 [Gymnopus androsaceus JB14]
MFPPTIHIFFSMLRSSFMRQSRLCHLGRLQCVSLSQWLKEKHWGREVPQKDWDLRRLRDSSKCHSLGFWVVEVGLWEQSLPSPLNHHSLLDHPINPNNPIRYPLCPSSFEHMWLSSEGSKKRPSGTVDKVGFRFATTPMAAMLGTQMQTQREIRMQ